LCPHRRDGPIHQIGFARQAFGTGTAHRSASGSGQGYLERRARYRANLSPFLSGPASNVAYSVRAIFRSFGTGRPLPRSEPIIHVACSCLTTSRTTMSARAVSISLVAARHTAERREGWVSAGSDRARRLRAARHPYR
jgi:hypothetical protein